MNIFSATAILLILVGCTQKQESWDINSDKEGILKVLENQQMAWNSGDLDNFMIGYLEADSLMFVGSSGIIHGYHNTLERYRNTYSNRNLMGRLEFTVNELKPVTREVYFMAGEYYLTRDSLADASGIFTLVWKKLGEDWVIVADHSE